MTKWLTQSDAKLEGLHGHFLILYVDVARSYMLPVCFNNELDRESQQREGSQHNHLQSSSNYKYLMFHKNTFHFSLHKEISNILFLNLTFICVHNVPQLSAYDSGIIVIPAICTHCSPYSIDADLHCASALERSINQTKGSISAIPNSCEENYTWLKNDCYLRVPSSLGHSQILPRSCWLFSTAAR